MACHLLDIWSGKRLGALGVRKCSPSFPIVEIRRSVVRRQFGWITQKHLDQMKFITVTTPKRLAGICGRHSPSCAAAFTLVEVLMAVAITAIMFASIFTTISSGNIIIQSTRENLRATQIIESRMEGLRLIAWGSSSNQLFDANCVTPSFTETFYPLGISGGGSSQGVTYYGSMNIQQSPTLVPASSYNTQMCLVTVTVNWTNQHYNVLNSHTRQMSTFVAQNGLQNYIYYATNN